mgnify:CR=1 FL=1|tara:strand:+ start:357 stop:743 length:387 start_codon:yes stop_codon:yes gene_type:complete
MESADVISVYADTNSAPTGDVMVIDIGDYGSCRVFSVVWCPYSLLITEQPRLQIWSGDPSDGSSSILYEDGAVRGGESFFVSGSDQTGQSFLRFSASPSHYFRSEKDIWARGISPGVNNVTLTYQMGG